ncbi:hypothetical protein EAH72_34660 [Pseudomonas caspiana]|nr:hypothetical protein EAH72_34660 [Pseudomonas caspiana]
MNSMPDHLPDDLQLLRQMLARMQSRIGFLEEENALLRQRLFGRKSQAVFHADEQRFLNSDPFSCVLCGCGWCHVGGHRFLDRRQFLEAGTQGVALANVSIR